MALALLCWCLEVKQVSRRTLGILTTVLGSALGAWWWTNQRVSRRTARRVAAPARGTVIFENHAIASENADGLV
jgi:hypothetical protein